MKTHRIKEIMKTKDFIYHLVERDKRLVRNYTHSQFRPEVAALSQFMNFPCHIKNGGCVNYLRSDSGMCCCSNCGYSIGHFGKYWPNNVGVLAYYARRYRRGDGFWRRDRGCVLPRHKRSLTCSFFICDKIGEAFNITNNGEIENLRMVVSSYTGCPYRNGAREGQYKSDWIRTEKELALTVDKFMWDHMLHYSAFKEKLVEVEKQTISETGYVKRYIKGYSSWTSYRNGKKWIAHMKKKIDYEKTKPKYNRPDRL